jgi:hypothetical protein
MPKANIKLNQTPRRLKLEAQTSHICPATPMPWQNSRRALGEDQQVPYMEFMHTPPRMDPFLSYARILLAGPKTS